MFEEKTINALKWMVGVLNKHNVEYQIAGGFAAKLYGSKRSLNDIDFDIHDEDFEKIISEVASYIKFGPARLVNEKWDCLLITLNYYGQEIDISGADTARMSTKDLKSWIQYEKQDFDTTPFIVDGLMINVMKPEELLEYKNELTDREYQKEDVSALQQYLIKNRSV